MTRPVHSLTVFVVRTDEDVFVSFGICFELALRLPEVCLLLTVLPLFYNNQYLWEMMMHVDIARHIAYTFMQNNVVQDAKPNFNFYFVANVEILVDKLVAV